MKVSAIILAIAVASVSAHVDHVKKPAPEALNFKTSDPAVRANAGKAFELAEESTKYAFHSAADVGREAYENVAQPSLQVAGGSLAGTRDTTAGFMDRRIGDSLGALSAVQKKLAQASESVTNYLYNAAGQNSQRFEDWHGASVVRDNAAAENFESAKQPLRNVAESVAETTADVKDKIVDAKNKSVQKAHERKEEAKARAEEAKQNAEVAKDKTVNYGQTVTSRLKGVLGRGVEKSGEAVERTGEAIKDGGANIRSRNEDRVEELERERLVLKENSASTFAISGAAIAVASAVAVSLI